MRHVSEQTDIPVNTLKRIVQTDSFYKNRFMIKDDRFIRAEYGHSGGCGDIWNELAGVSGGYAVHGTNLRNMGSIVEAGLQPRGRDVHMCPLETMDILGRPNSDLFLLVDIGKCPVEIRACANGVMLARETIPSSVLRFFGRHHFELGHARIFSRHLSYVAGLTKVVILSDSMLKAQPGSLVLSKEPHALVSAFGGFTVSDLLSVLSCNIQSVQSFDGKFFIFIGTNDSHSFNFNLPSFTRSFRLLLDFVHTHFPFCKIFFFSLLPRRLPSCFNQFCNCKCCQFFKSVNINVLKVRIVLINECIKKLCQMYNKIEYIHLFSLFTDHDSYLSHDGLHLSTTGNVFIDSFLSSLL